MHSRTLLIIGIALLTALTRLLPHPPNFTPLGAVALFGAAYLDNKWAVFLVPLSALFVSDLALQLTTSLDLYSGWMAQTTGIYQGMWVVYAAVAMIAAIGMTLRKQRNFWTISENVLTCSVVFFVITNFSVWAFQTIYPHTWQGLIACYVAAIPFFHYTLAGDIFFATILFGALALAERRYPALRMGTT